jgi:lysyl-tRNA synthetase class 2
MSSDEILPFKKHVLDPRRKHALAVRHKVESGIRSFFLNQFFLETRTPILVKSPGMEPYIRPYKLSTGEFLQTSPEFAMKKLLAGGLEKIFQICPVFRYEPNSSTHSPEFIMLEWYRAHQGFERIMKDMEDMVEKLAQDICGSTFITFGDKKIEVKTPWPRLKVYDLFLKVDVDLVKSSELQTMRDHVQRLGLNWNEADTWDDLYNLIWLNFIEPKLPQDRAVFVTQYPPSQAALSVIEKDESGIPWAKRFEPYAGGLELGNAFEELTDATEQRRRFEEDMDLREQVFGSSFPRSPIDEDFIRALEEGLPPCSGIAVGVDRLVMLLANEQKIEFTQWLPAYVHQE